MSCGVGCRRGSDPELLSLWCRPAATALIGPLAWEPPYAMGAAQEVENKQRINNTGSSRHGAAVTNPTRIHGDVDSMPGLTHWIKDLVFL